MIVTGAATVYVLTTPKDGDETDENSRLWFLDLSSSSPWLDLSKFQPKAALEESSTGRGRRPAD